MADYLQPDDWLWLIRNAGRLESIINYLLKPLPHIQECLQVCHILFGHTCLSELQGCWWYWHFDGYPAKQAILFIKTKSIHVIVWIVIYQVRILTKMQKDVKKVYWTSSECLKVTFPGRSTLWSKVSLCQAGSIFSGLNTINVL